MRLWQTDPHFLAEGWQEGEFIKKRLFGSLHAVNGDSCKCIILEEATAERQRRRLLAKDHVSISDGGEGMS